MADGSMVDPECSQNVAVVETAEPAETELTGETLIPVRCGSSTTEDQCPLLFVPWQVARLAYLYWL